MDSVWLKSEKNNFNFKELDTDVNVDVCIVGAGIFGITIGYYLSNLGFSVALIDKNNICERTTGFTTGKITSQHSAIYNYLYEQYGKNFAYKYLQANEKAIHNIENIITKENINCNFEKTSSYLYTTKKSDVLKLEKEYNTLTKLNYDCNYLKSCPLPFPIESCIEFKNQAQFNVIKYLYGLIKPILKRNGQFFINSTVHKIEEQNNNFIAYSDKGKIQSKYLINATHYPFIKFPGFYFLKMYQSTSYTIAVETKHQLFNGMFINTSDPIFSYRTCMYDDKKLLLISGNSHKTGKTDSAISNYKVLENKAYSLYDDSKILFKWSNKDCITIDKLPYIGNFSNLYENMYIATGFNKWGMTLSNVAANIIVDKILKRENQFEDIFNSTRFKPIKNRGELKNMISDSSNYLIFNKFKINKKEIPNLLPDECKTIKVSNKIIGIYKDISGDIFCVEPICTHLGCLLSWNSTDKTWDCPCHGSRFNYKGENISDPAFKNLSVINLNNIDMP